MPSGVFLPYSAVSTAVLIFTKTNTGGTDKAWFYDMKADGFTLDQKRAYCDDNDIDDIIARYSNLSAEESRSRKEKSFLVSVDEIRENNYDLSISKYKESEKVETHFDSPDVILSRIEQLHNDITTAIAHLKSII